MIEEQGWARHPVVIVVAPTGAEVTRDDNPAVPYTAQEIARAVIDAAAAGASVAHLHVREDDGTPSARPEVFIDVIERIRAESDIVTMVSTGGAVGMSLEDRVAGLEAAPDMCGIEVGSTNFGDELFATLPAETEEIARRAAALGVALEVEAFEVGHVDTALAMAEAGVLPHPLRMNLVFGVRGAVGPWARNLAAMVAAVPPGVPWGVTAVGRHQQRMIALAVLLGATCIRVGFEDNVYAAKGRLASSNAELVARAADIVTTLGRTVAGPGQARELLGIAGP